MGVVTYGSLFSGRVVVNRVHISFLSGCKGLAQNYFTGTL